MHSGTPSTQITRVPRVLRVLSICPLRYSAVHTLRYSADHPRAVVARAAERKPVRSGRLGRRGPARVQRVREYSRAVSLRQPPPRARAVPQCGTYGSAARTRWPRHNRAPCHCAARRSPDCSGRSIRVGVVTCDGVRCLAARYLLQWQCRLPAWHAWCWLHSACCALHTRLGHGALCVPHECVTVDMDRRLRRWMMDL